MGEKRKLPARASARVESSTKKRKSTPPEPLPKAPTPVPVVVEEVLPKTVVAGKALPTVPEPQPENLSTREYKSIPESGVLQESLSRSRHRWICEGIFERYWTKPKKVKGHVEEPPNNPAKDTMTKLGPCTITVEPHTFDAIMWAVKDTTPRPPPPPPQPMYRPIIQYGPTNGMLSPQVSQPPPPPQHRPYVPPPPASSPGIAGVLRPPGHPSPSPAPQTPTTANTRPPASSPAPAQPPHMNNTPINTYQQSPSHPPRPAPPPVSQGSTPGPSQPSGQTNGTVPPPAPPAKSPDPVIQALAERAATDADLKALMRIVAGGKANPDELRKFQAHIDDLNKLLNIKPKPAPSPASHPPPPPPSGNIYQTQSPNPLYRSSPAPAPSPAPLQPHVKQEYHMQSPAQSQALRSKGPVAPPKPDISGICFEFVGPGATGDRFLFPKYSILEFQPLRHEFVASFLIVRKGSSSDSTSYDPKLDYYQPVTIRIWAQSPKNLEALSKVVAPAEDVRKYMDDIMDKATRAEYVLLAMRLPKDPEPTPVAQDFAKREQQDDSVLWSNTNGTPAPKQKTVKVGPSEEQQYQNFITTISAA